MRPVSAIGFTPGTGTLPELLTHARVRRGLPPEAERAYQVLRGEPTSNAGLGPLEILPDQVADLARPIQAQACGPGVRPAQQLRIDPDRQYL